MMDNIEKAVLIGEEIGRTLIKKTKLKLPTMMLQNIFRKSLMTTMPFI